MGNKEIVFGSGVEIICNNEACFAAIIDVEYDLYSFHVIFCHLLQVKVSERSRQTAISGYFTLKLSSD